MKNFDGHWIGTEEEESGLSFRCCIDVSENVFTFSFTRPDHPSVKLVRTVASITGEQVELSGGGAEPFSFTLLSEGRIQFRSPSGVLSIFERE